MTTTAPDATTESSVATDPTWKASACILCESNCGIEIRLGEPTRNGASRRFERIRGDKAHPGSGGYTCEKALRLDHYQNGGDRLTSPLRRRPDGTFEEIDWDTAISEVAAGFKRIKETYGGETIFAYGGGGQGNHLGGGYSGATFRALGLKYRTNALAQEKTGEFWVSGKMFGGITRADFLNSEVALFVGKNPWQSHGFPHARTTLKEIAADPNRSLIVIDPRRTETADLADFHLQVKPGTDAWCVAALGAVLVQENLVSRSWVNDHVTGASAVMASLHAVDVPSFAELCGVDEDLIRRTARRIASASSVGVFEDLGVQMNLHSTLVSWLEKIVWVLTGNFGKPGAQFIPSSLVALARTAKGGAKSEDVKRSPVVGARIISGLVPCNVVPDEILTDHPDRYRAMFVESGNPAHSIADSQRMREALQALELLVVVDVAMTETARLAHYVLPAASQYEKAEATFFNFEFPGNVFHLRHPILEPLPGTLVEPEIHARLAEALGYLAPEKLAPLHEAAANGRAAYAAAFFAAIGADPELGELAPLVLYRTLGPVLPKGLASAALLWGAAHRCALTNPAGVARAGFTGEGLEPGEKLFEAILEGAHGVTFCLDDYDESWRRVKTDDGKISVDIAEMRDMLDDLSAGALRPPNDPDFPVVLSAGERRSFTANTIFRDNSWRKKDGDGALRVSPADADTYGLVDGGRALITTRRGSAAVLVEVNTRMRAGHMSLPNGMGVGTSDDVRGVAPNELTDSAWCDTIAGTPFHKHVPARVEAISAS